MKVASTLTNTALDSAGLPSLLSSEVDLLLPSLDRLALPVEATNAESASTESVATFDAVLAMFGQPQNLPQEQVPRELTTRQLDPLLPRQPELKIASDGVAESLCHLKSDHGLSQRQTSRPADLLDINDVVSPPLGLGIASLQRIQSVTSVIVPSELAVLVPSTADSTATLAIESQAVSQDFDAPKLLQASTTISPDEVGQVHPTISLPLRTPSVMGASAPRDSSGLLPSNVSRLHDPDEADTESKPLSGGELSTISGKPVVSFEFVSAPDAIEFSQHVSESRHEFLEEKPPRHRHATFERHPTAEVATPAALATESSVREPNQLDVKSWSEQLSTAMQTHSEDLSAGKPLELRLRLDPPELGIVRVHLRLTEESVSVRFIAGDEAVTRMLESQLPDLRQSLAERGLSFGQCDVMCDGRQQQSSSFGRDTEPMSSMPNRRESRTWQKPAFVSRSVVLRSDRVDVLA